MFKQIIFPKPGSLTWVIHAELQRIRRDQAWYGRRQDSKESNYME